MLVIGNAHARPPSSVAPWRARNRLPYLVSHGGNVRLRRALDALTHLVGTHPWLFVDTLRDRKANSYVHGASTMDEAAEQWAAHADTLLAECDLDSLARLVFSHNGLKNKLHMAVREDMREEDNNGHIALTFGDLGMAHDALGRISPGLDAMEAAESQGIAYG